MGAAVNETEWLTTIIGIGIPALSVWLLRLNMCINRMLERQGEYVPRTEINQRFRDIKNEIHTDMTAQERRSDKQFEELKQYLIRIEEKLGDKADKQRG